MPDDTTFAAPASARFDACLAIVLALEGGYVDDPRDLGGATNLGITRDTLAAWRHVTPASSLPVSEVAALTPVEAGSIYRALYWNRCSAGALPPGLDLALFDFAVNSGPDRALRTLREALGVAIDGLVGPVTLGAVAAAAPVDLVRALCDRRLVFLKSLATWPSFGAGWSNRVSTIRAKALAMAPAAAAIPSPAKKGTSPMNLTFLAGYKTYIVGAAMLIAALAQLLGVAIPDFTGQSAGEMLMQGLAIVFLRQGIASTAAKS